MAPSGPSRGWHPRDVSNNGSSQQPFKKGELTAAPASAGSGSSKFLVRYIQFNQRTFNSVLLIIENEIISVDAAKLGSSVLGYAGEINAITHGVNPSPPMVSMRLDSLSTDHRNAYYIDVECVNKQTQDSLIMELEKLTSCKSKPVSTSDLSRDFETRKGALKGRLSTPTADRGSRHEQTSSSKPREQDRSSSSTNTTSRPLTTSSRPPGSGQPPSAPRVHDLDSESHQMSSPFESGKTPARSLVTDGRDPPMSAVAAVAARELPKKQKRSLSSNSAEQATMGPDKKLKTSGDAKLTDSQPCTGGPSKPHSVTSETSRNASGDSTFTPSKHEPEEHGSSPNLLSTSPKEPIILPLRSSASPSPALAQLKTLPWNRPVRVEVGSSPSRTFWPHQRLLALNSTLFQADTPVRASASGSTSGSEHITITVPDQTPKLFGDFHAWLYSNALIHSHTSNYSYPTLFALWALGNALGAPAFRDYIVGVVYDKIAVYGAPTAMEARDAWVPCTEGSGLRQLVVDALASARAGRDAYEGDASGGGEIMELLRAVLVAKDRQLVAWERGERRGRYRGQEYGGLEARCTYCEHGVGEECGRVRWFEE